MRTDPQITGFVFTIQDSYGNTGEVWAHFWNNNKYIDQSFWELNPDDQNIISALYGSNDSWLDTTAYTQSRSGRDTTQCSGDTMQVVYKDVLDTTALASNTIYVLTNPLSIMASTTVLANCSAVISKNATGTLFTSTIQL